MAHISAALFDVDGTLVDSNRFRALAWQEAFKSAGRELSYDEVFAQMGKSGDQHRDPAHLLEHYDKSPLAQRARKIA